MERKRKPGMTPDNTHAFPLEFSADDIYDSATKSSNVGFL